MGFERLNTKRRPVFLRAESGQLVSPYEMGAKILNFTDTPEGTMESVWGPCPYVPDYGQGYPTYGRTHGIFHTRLLNGQREVLLIQSGAQIDVFNGSTQSWDALAGPSGGSPELVADIPNNAGSQFPCQFESTPVGVVIVPQGARAMFYDGIKILPLGYERAPGAPSAHGPESPGSSFSTNNTEGYSVRAASGGNITVHADFGNGRVGSVGSYSTSTSGENGCLEDRYQAAMQWIDAFGNVSPLSVRSAEVVFRRAHAGSGNDSGEDYLHWLKWGSLENGRDGTVGKLVSRTRSLTHSGSNKLYVLPNDFGVGGSGVYASIPDNQSRFFSDNVPNAWLLNEPVDAMPVPRFKLCRMAYGRLWIANIDGNPGMMVPSIPGRYGTFERDSEVFPDPRGGEITGMWFAQQVLLVCTASTTFAIMPADDGIGYKSVTIHPTLGCVAPSSFANMANGMAVWLSREGFVGFHEGKIDIISGQQHYDIQKINWTRARQACAAYDTRSREYRCWAPYQGSRENNLCWVYNGQGWKRRNDVKARAVCVTQDPRSYMITVGLSTDSGATTRDGVWLLDHEGYNYVPATRVASIETSWIGAADSLGHKSPRNISCWMRETDDGTATLKLWRDYRKVTRTDATFVSPKTDNIDLDPPADPAAIWGSTLWGTTVEPFRWTRRRLYWTDKQFYLPDCEAYKLELASAQRIEFMAFAFIEHGQDNPARTV